MNFKRAYVPPADISDLSNLKQGKNELMCGCWPCFLKKKNEIADCDDSTTIAPFKFGASHKFHSREPKTTPALMEMLSNYSGEDLWLPS